MGIFRTWALSATLVLAALGSVAVAAPPTVDASVDASSVEEAVSGLIADALAANLELEEAGATVAERLAVLDQARAHYLPSLDLAARYSRADGGRALDFPIGDLLNPVYSALNKLTGSTQFASVQNQQINFQRTREQDTKLSLTQPIYDARISSGRAAAQSQYEAAMAARSALAGRLERDMRQAYYRWLQARAQVGILDAAVELASENLRVNESLFRNGKITRDLVYRAEADLLEVKQLQQGAGSALRLAQSYVNLVRNSPFERALPLSVAADVGVGVGVGVARGADLASLQGAALKQRAELRQLDAVEAAAAAGERLARAAFKPQLAFAMDAGIQGSTYGLGSDERYVLASLVLRFNLFAGGADQAGVSLAHAALRQARAERGLREQQIRLQVQKAAQDLDDMQASLGTAEKRVEAAGGAFHIAQKKRDLGQINQAEFIDARRGLTDAELNLNVTRFAALSSLAELRYALGDATHRPPPIGQP